jgi:hypothetical protein
MMFVQFQVLQRTGASDPPEGVELQLIRVDLIQRVRPITLPGWDEPAVEVLLENEAVEYCQGTVQAILQSIDEVCRD